MSVEPLHRLNEFLSFQAHFENGISPVTIKHLPQKIIHPTCRETIIRSYLWVHYRLLKFCILLHFLIS